MRVLLWRHACSLVACTLIYVLCMFRCRYVPLFIERCMTLLRHDLRIVVVFDGKDPLVKHGTKAERQRFVHYCFFLLLCASVALYCAHSNVFQFTRIRIREEAFKEGMRLYEAGSLDKAEKKFRQSVHRTREIENALQAELRRRKIDYLVSPFEADSQMAFLCREGIVDGACSTDSDLIVLETPLVSVFMFSILYSSLLLARSLMRARVCVACQLRIEGAFRSRLEYRMREGVQKTVLAKTAGVRRVGVV